MNSDIIVLLSTVKPFLLSLDISSIASIFIDNSLSLKNKHPCNKIEQSHSIF